MRNSFGGQGTLLGTGPSFGGHGTLWGIGVVCDAPIDPYARARGGRGCLNITSCGFYVMVVRVLLPVLVVRVPQEVTHNETGNGTLATQTRSGTLTTMT